ncbi:MAG TPA: hypothetical protein P5250_02890, partial [Bacteroidales bacterium]|nr:hypothetical protein [Bacteroidales bacterium]
MKKLVFSLFLVAAAYYAVSQITILNSKYIGGSLGDHIRFFYPLNNGNYIIGGSSYSNDGDLTSNNGNNDCFFTKIDDNLNITNLLSFGESEYDYITDVSTINDSSFVLLINSNSSTGIFSGNKGSYDTWIRSYYISPLWLSSPISYGGTGDDCGYNIIPKATGGYIICGYSTSNDGDLPANYGTKDFWVLNLTNTWSVAWSKNYGGSNDDVAIKVFQLNDGNILVFGNTISSNNMVHNFKGVKDIWVVKLNSMGDTIWTKTYGGSGYDEIINVKRIGNNQFAMIGTSNSIDGDFMYIAKQNNEKVSYSYGFYHVIDDNGQFVCGGTKSMIDNNVSFKDIVWTNQQDVEVFGYIDTDTSLLANYDIIILNYNNGLNLRLDTIKGNEADGTLFIASHKLNSTDFFIAASSLSSDLAPNYHGDYEILLAIVRKNSVNNTKEFNNMPNINLFPNPANRIIYINNLPTDKRWMYNIFDISGKNLI